MTQSTPQQSTPQHTAAQQPAPYGRPGAGGPALPQADYRICLLYTSPSPRDS